ncbi:MAG: hypothetical protein ABJA35_10070 [Parafilimonas sp.]
MEVNIDNTKKGKAELYTPFQNVPIVQLPAKIKVPPKTSAVAIAAATFVGCA